MVIVKFYPKQWFVSIKNDTTGDEYWLKFYKNGAYLSKVELIEYGSGLKNVLGGVKVQRSMTINRFLKSEDFRNLMMQVGYSK